MPRPMTPHEMNLTQQDIAFKQMLLTEVEDLMKNIAPALFDALIESKLGQWIDDTVAVVNHLEERILHLENQLNPSSQGATHDIPQPADPAPDSHLDDIGD